MISAKEELHRCKFSMTLRVRLMVGRSVGLCHNFLQGWEIAFTCSKQNTCLCTRNIDCNPVYIISSSFNLGAKRLLTD